MKFAFNATTGKLDLVNKPEVGFELTVDTKANITALTPDEPTVAFATDTNQYLVWTGSNWHKIDLPLAIQSANPDPGVSQDSARTGYRVNYLTDKKLYNIVLGGGEDTEEEGALRYNTNISPARMELRSRGKYNKILEDVTIDDGDFRHTPLNEQIYVWRGDSVAVGMNGRSLVQEYRVTPGAYPPVKVISGGTF